MTREKIIFAALLLLVAGVMAYSPLRHGFIYPTGGDDTAFHIQDLQKLTADFGYVAHLRYYGIALLVPFTLLGLSAVTVFSAFNYAVIVAMFVSLWLLVRRFYGFPAAVLSFWVAAFVAMGTWYYFDDGTIFNIFNLYVVGVFGIYCLCSWLDSGKYKWLIGSALLFILASLVHNTTYLYMLAAMVLFVPGYAAFRFIKKDGIMLRRTLIFGAVFVPSILTAGVSWARKTLPALGESAVSSVTQGTPSAALPFSPPSSFPDWFIHDLNIGTVVLLVLALAVLSIKLIKGKQEENRKVLSGLNQPLSYLILCFIIVLIAGAFTRLGLDSNRFAMDLATFVGLGTAILLGIVLAGYNFRYKYLLVMAAALVLAVSSVPVYRWLGDYTALRPCDVQTIDFLNSLPPAPLKVDVSSAVAPWIYRLYTHDNIAYAGISGPADLQGADYIIYRNNPMTYLTAAETPAVYLLLNSYIRESPPLLSKVAGFDSGNDEITVYKVVKSP